MFESLNPDSSTDEIDFAANVDSALTLSENRAIMSEAYPQFAWYKQAVEEIRIPSRVQEEEEEIDRLYAEYLTVAGS